MADLAKANGRSFADRVSAPLVPQPSREHLRVAAAGQVTGGGSHAVGAEHDAELARAVRRAAWMRQGFYGVVLLVALAGQVTGAVEALHIPLIAAVPAVAALELGGVVVLANADVRRRLGERAVASRLLSALIASWAVAFNWLAHGNHLLGGFYSGMSALGYLVWLMHTENQRRDRLRAKGDLPPTTPGYEIWGHWLRHPLLTARAKSLAKRDPKLGLYGSIDAARAEVRREHRHSAIAKVLHRKIRAAVTPTEADIAVAVYDLDEIAVRVAGMAQYDKLAVLVAEGLAPERLGVAVDRPAGSPTDRPVRALTDRPTDRVNSRSDADRPTGSDTPGGLPTVRPSAPPNVRPTPRSVNPPPSPRSVKGPTARSKTPTDPVGHSPAARSNAAELRRRYPDGLPADWTIRIDTEWGAGRVTKARAAHEAGADLKP